MVMSCCLTSANRFLANRLILINNNYSINIKNQYLFKGTQIISKFHCVIHFFQTIFTNEFISNLIITVIILNCTLIQNSQSDQLIIRMFQMRFTLEVLDFMSIAIPTMLSSNKYIISYTIYRSMSHGLAVLYDVRPSLKQLL